MAWRLARSLERLRNEADQAAPERSKASDGTIGDAAHTARTSDHNPDSYGIVAALDLTHDPEMGADMHVWADMVQRSGHPALKYIIWNRRITSRAVDGLTRWRDYNGTNPHTSHMHVSVERPHYDDYRPWNLEGDDMPSIEEVEAAAYRAVVLALRQAVGPDEGHIPAGKYFNEIKQVLYETRAALRDASDVDIEALAKAIVRAFMEENQS